MRQRTLGEFLRKHRELVVDPPDNKQADERRRRTSGLRREEVAQMAGISSAWYTRLEQGKEVTPSGAALCRVAEALRLGPAERPTFSSWPGELTRTMPRTLRTSQLARQLKVASFPFRIQPSYLTSIGHRYSGISILEICSLHGLRGSEINVLRYVFLDLNARTFAVDWEARARRILANSGSTSASILMIRKCLSSSEGFERSRISFGGFGRIRRFCFGTGTKSPSIILNRVC